MFTGEPDNFQNTDELRKQFEDQEKYFSESEYPKNLEKPKIGTLRGKL